LKKLLLSLGLVPITYLVIASVLTLAPIKRDQPTESLDFSVLDTDLSDSSTLVERYYTARDGSELFYRYLPGDTNTALVLLHGSGSEGRYLMPLATKLNSSTGISVVIPDLRGHGRSALPKIGDIDYLGQYVDDLEDLNSYLRAETEDSTIILGGHSSGGGLAIKYGAEGQLPFDRYLLLTPYLGYQAPTVRPDSGGWIQVSTRRYAGLSMFNNVGVTLFNGLPVMFFNRPAEFADPLQADSYSYRLNESFSPQDYSANLEANKKPILVLVGTEDEAFYPSEFKPTFNKYAPDADVHLVPGAKHLDLPASKVAVDSIESWLEN
jgi:non-heme chloroperoxidase